MKTKPAISAKSAELREFRAQQEHRPMMRELYRRAEAQLRKQRKQPGAEAEDTKSAVDSQRLLHELQVHQVELEMQNEELQKARDEMEAGLEKYSDLYDFAPVGYLTLDHEGIIRETNLAGASLLGIARATLVKQRFGFFVSPADRPVFAAFLKQVFKSGTREECDVRLLGERMPPVDVRMRANVFDSGQACLVAVSDITEHKLAEAATAQLAAIVNSSNDAIIGKDLNSIVTSWNAGAEKIFGYSAGEMVGCSITRLIPPDRQQEEGLIMSRIKQGESVEHFETVRVAKDGRLLDVSLTVSPIRYATGKIVGASKVARDITDHKRVEDQVRVSEIRHRRLFETAHDGILILDPGTCKITDANPLMTKLLGYPRDQLVGKELFEIGLLKDEVASREMFRKLKKKHEVRYEDLPLESQGGRHQEVEVVANLYQENGHAVIQCNIRDITKRKFSENALRESEERFRTLFELGPVAVYSIDASGVIRNFNRRAAELWGRKPAFGNTDERFCGSFKLFRPDGSRMPHEQCPMAEVVSGKIPGARDTEVLIERPDGSRITVIVNIRPLKNERGEITGAINCFYDITERKAAEEAQRRIEVLAASNRRLHEEIMRRQAVEAALHKSEQHQTRLLEESRNMQEQLRQLSRQILSAQEEERREISRELHDVIAQTLTGINVRLAALKKEAARDTKDLDRNITRTQKLVEHSVNIVHEFARELRPAVLDDLGLIPALHSFVKNFSKRTRVHVQLKIFAGVERLDISKRTVLYRVAQEALTNVTRHAKASRVELSIQKFPDCIGMKIKDDGKSFEVERILNAKGNKRLGLLGMRERVEMVGGTFCIESAPGKGTTVIAQIPLGKTRAGGGALRESAVTKPA